MCIRDRFLNRYLKDRALGESLLFQQDVEIANATEVVMRVLKAGEYIPDKYTKSENRIINEYFTAANQILKMGLSQGETMDNMLRFIFPTTLDADYPIKSNLQLQEAYKKVTETLFFLKQEGKIPKETFDQLKVDTGSDTLIVLMGNDDSPIPSFG